MYISKSIQVSSRVQIQEFSCKIKTPSSYLRSASQLSHNVTLCMHCMVGHSTASKSRGFIHNPQQLKDFHCKFSFTWNIPLSGMLLYAKSKIPILPIPNRSQFDYMCLVNFSTAKGISFPERKTQLREQLSHPSDRQESSGLFVSCVPEVQEQGGPPWTQHTVSICLAFPGVKSLHSPGRSRAAPGALHWTSPAALSQGRQRVPAAGSCSSCSPHISFITHHL